VEIYENIKLKDSLRNSNYLYDDKTIHKDVNNSLKEKALPLRQDRELGHAVQPQVTIPEPSETILKTRMALFRKCLTH